MFCLREGVGVASEASGPGDEDGREEGPSATSSAERPWIGQGSVESDSTLELGFRASALGSSVEFDSTLHFSVESDRKHFHSFWCLVCERAELFCAFLLFFFLACSILLLWLTCEQGAEEAVAPRDRGGRKTRREPRKTEEGCQLQLPVLSLPSRRRKVSLVAVAAKGGCSGTRLFLSGPPPSV